MNDDTISRAAAIDILDAYQVMVENGEENPYAWARLRMSELPSAQPESEERKAESVQNVPKEDLISRKAAIDALDCISGVEEVLRSLPPAQPETATVTIGRTKGGVTMWYECDACGEPIDSKDCYCRNCGRKLKHEY